jgi:predicted regulator of Ras-like GTPase activity (Roadblock/LC7/MglB family)
MFQSILARLAARAGARWAMIVGTDGVLLETNARAFRTEAEGLAAELAALYRASREAAGETEIGRLESTLLTTDQGRVLFQALNQDYVIILFLEPEAYPGKAFFEVSRASNTIEKELAC